MKSAVLFLTYRRIETARRVFSAIRRAKPPRLYFASNAANPVVPEEKHLVDEVRALRAEIDWECEVQTLFRTEHLNVRDSICGAIDWFFDHEPEGIILEDDCLPHPDFFGFCDEMLERYRGAQNVATITGNFFQPKPLTGAASYYFSKYVHIWGWATWRRSWQNYDRNIKFWDHWKLSDSWKNTLPDPVERKYWEKRFDAVSRGDIVTWDYQLLGSIWKGGGLTVTPGVNLVSNIGFGPDSQFTKDPSSPLADLPTGSIFPITHPAKIAVNARADRYDFDFGFGGRHQRPLARGAREAKRVVFRRIVRPVYRILKNGGAFWAQG